METSIEGLKKRILKIKKKRPGYEEILNFYFKLKKEQEKIKPSLKIEPIPIREDLQILLSEQGFSLIEKKDFPIDVESAIHLFKALCKIGKKANPYMSREIEKLEDSIQEKRVELKALFNECHKEEKIEEILRNFGLNGKMFIFLLKESIRPSIEEGMQNIDKKVDKEKWLKNFCPICGSLPYLSLLKEEVGKKFLICSWCSCQWRYERISCPFCTNKEQDSLSYFYGEGEEAYRIDTCEKCKQYIKTIDLRKVELIDPILEDISTLHLDLIASKKGYKRPTSNPWLL